MASSRLPGRLGRLLLVFGLLVPGVGSAAEKIPIVAAENVYGDLAQQVGGPDVEVISILNNPDQDPHLFEASPSVARNLAKAALVLYNGLDYDPWIEKLLSAARNPARKSIDVAALTQHKTGDNPHIWYDQATMRAAAKAIADTLGDIDPGHRASYQDRQAKFAASLDAIATRMAALRQRLEGREATATEPVFGYMLEALGLTIRNPGFQLAVMNDTEPSASDIAGFERDLKTRHVALLVYNKQAASPVAQRMIKLATASLVPMVGVTETLPPQKTYQTWILDELTAIDHAVPE